MLILMLTGCLAVLTVSPEKKEKLIDVIKIESLTIGDCECIIGWLMHLVAMFCHYTHEQRVNMIKSEIKVEILTEFF